jgi:hypothetical protein
MRLSSIKVAVDQLIARHGDGDVAGYAVVWMDEDGFGHFLQSPPQDGDRDEFVRALFDSTEEFILTSEVRKPS